MCALVNLFVAAQKPMKRFFFHSVVFQFQLRSWGRGKSLRHAAGKLIKLIKLILAPNAVSKSLLIFLTVLCDGSPLLLSFFFSKRALNKQMLGNWPQPDVFGEMKSQPLAVELGYALTLELG